MLTVGITGNIGSGKSWVSSLLKEKGFQVFDTDTNAKQSMLEEPIKSQLIQLLGTEVYDTEGNVNRSWMAKQIFSNPILLEQVNTIIHSIVKQNFFRWASESGQKIVFKESAILLEVGAQKELDFIVVVDCPLNIRLKRVMSRDKSTEEEVLMRMKNQWSDEEKRKHANFIILNDGIEPLEPQINQLLQVLQSKV